MEDPDDDFRLVARAQQGDFGSYDVLVTRHRGRIFAMIRNMIHQEADAWDLSQEVFIKAWNALPRFEAKARFSTWLYRIAHNVVYDWTRKRKIESVGELNDEIFERERIDSASLTTPSGGESPDDSMARGELRVKIEAALGKLSAGTPGGGPFEGCAGTFLQGNRRGDGVLPRHRDEPAVLCAPETPNTAER